MGWEIAHECDPRYHCCVHDECLDEGDPEGECGLFGLTKEEAGKYLAEAAREADGDEDEDE